jgi:hypothetical protein
MRKAILSLLMMTFFNNFGIAANTAIKCILKNPIDSIVTFSIIEGTITQKESFFEKKITQNTVVFELDIQKPIVVRVAHDYHYFEVFCEPSDQLLLEFDAETYPTDIAFSGKGSLQNTFLHLFKSQFVEHSHRNIMRKTYQLDGLGFRKYMDGVLKEKWTFYGNYNQKLKNAFSAQFRHFIQNEISYWHAYYLMNYREEHISIVSDEGLYLPDAYFDFLDEVLINNDNAFQNTYYIKFLDSYSKFRAEKPDFIHGLAARQSLIFPNNDNVSLYKDIECEVPMSAFKKNQSAIILETITYLAQHEKTPTAYRYKVKTDEGQYGWLRSIDTRMLNFADKINNKTLYINNYDTESLKNVVDATVIRDSLGIFFDPADKQMMAKIGIGEKLALLDNTTADNVSYQGGSDYVAAPFIKVRTSYGLMGWVTLAGVQLHYYNHLSSAFESKIPPISQTDFFNLDYFFYDKTFYYVWAKKLQEKLEYEGKEAVKPLFETYFNTCTDATMVRELSDFFENNNKKYNAETGDKKLTLYDKRSTNLNINTNQYHIPTDDKAFTKYKKSAYNNFIKRKIIEDNGDFKEITEIEPIAFPEVEYEMQEVELTCLKKWVSKHNVSCSIFPDIVNNEPKNISFYVKKGKRFFGQDTCIFKFSIAEPVTAKIVKGKDTVSLWLEPKQRLKLQERNDSLLITDGDLYASEVSNNIAAWKQNADKEVLKFYSTAPVLFKSNVLRIYTGLKESFAYTLAKGNLSKKFIKTMEAELDYWYINQLLKYPKQNKTTSLPINYYDFIQGLKIQNERALLSKEYRDFVHNYLQNQIDRNQHLDMPDREIARLVFSSRVLNYWQAAHINELLAKSMDEEALQFAQKFADDCSHAILLESLKNSLQVRGMSNNGYQLGDFTVMNGKNQLVHLEDLKQKNFALVFWNEKNFHTSFRKFEKSLRDKSKNVDKYYFVYTNSDYYRWQKLIKRSNRKNQLFAADMNTYALDLKNNKHSIIYFDQEGRVLEKIPIVNNFNVFLSENDKKK